MEKISRIENAYLRKEIPKFNVGDTVKVHVKIVEEDKTRLQTFEGIVIRKRGKDLSETFTVRRISYGEGIERIFPLHSPFLEKVEVVKPGKARRAKLYYLRKRQAKKADALL